MKRMIIGISLMCLFGCTASQESKIYSGSIAPDTKFQFSCPANFTEVDWNIKGVIKSFETKDGYYYFSIKTIFLDTITDKNLTTETITIESVQDDLRKSFKDCEIQAIDTNSHVGNLKAVRAIFVTGVAPKQLKRMCYYFYFKRHFFVLSGGAFKKPSSKNLEEEFKKFQPIMEQIVFTLKLTTE